uniref:glutathione transferase n=1 Tax=Amazona collaria TaxID=241587 RepID=A0A8B9FRB1_9PSIT
MSGRPRLTYLNGRGRMESIRWLLAAAGVEFEEIFLETKEQYEKIIKDGSLMFQQVPLVEIDGMKMVQTRAILSYIAGKYNLYGKDLKERALIDMYVEGIIDLMYMILTFPFSPPEAKEKNLDSIKERATNRYFPVFEKVSKSEALSIKLVFTSIRKLPPNRNMFIMQASSKSSAFLALSKKRKYSSMFLYFLAYVVRAVVFDNLQRNTLSAAEQNFSVKYRQAHMTCFP